MSLAKFQLPVWVFLATLCALAGCKGEELPQPALIPGPPKVGVYPLVSLTPRLRTHVVVDSRGNLYWSQETENGQDLLEVTGQSNVPRGLIASTDILKAMKISGGSGNIESLVMGRDDRIYFYFAGGKGPTTLAAIGSYNTRTTELAVLATTPQLASASGMGGSLELARGTLLGGIGAQMRLWLRHDEAGIVLNFDPFASLIAMELKPAFPAARGPSGEIRLRSEQEDMSPGPDGSLYYIDRKLAVLWQIAPDGHATKVQSLNGAPSALTPPTYDANGRLILLTGDSDSLQSPDLDAPIDHAFFADQPALFMLDAGKWSALGRDDFHAPEDFHLQTLQVAQLFPDHSLPETWIVFDSASGQLLRMKIER